MAILEPQWVVGFVDGEGCFNIDTHVQERSTYGLQMQPEFVVVQHSRDEQILHSMKEVFGCGNVSVNKSGVTSTRLQYRCKNIKDLQTKVIPFFEKHKLKTKKNIEFLRFRDIVNLMASGYHLISPQNFIEVVDLGHNLRYREEGAYEKGIPKRVNVNIILDKLRLKYPNPPV